MLFNRSFNLRKCRQILEQHYAAFKKRGDRLPPLNKKKLEETLKTLDVAIVKGDRKEANRIVGELGKLNFKELKKNPIQSAFEFVFSIAFALIIATIVKQIWFEPQKIPTGSMRPTFRENDLLAVSKTKFGLKIPLITDHFYFDPKLVQRASAIIFSGDNLPIPENDKGAYFWIFPAYKRYIKRLIGAPGDSIYFYGGKLYGVDKAGNPLKELLESPYLSHIDHIPFIDFEGSLSNPSPNIIQFEHLHRPYARLTLSHFGEQRGEVFNGKTWVIDNPTIEEHRNIITYSDLFGMRHFAKARLLTKQQLNPNSLDESKLYLELAHHPSLTYPGSLLLKSGRGIVPLLQPLKSSIPLNEEHLNAIMENLYTSRFVVKNGRAKLYDADNSGFGPFSPEFKEVPDGTYEFYNGILTQIYLGGLSKKAHKNHPLYQKNKKNIQRLFNLGMEMHSSFQPDSEKQHLFPHRYAYFRNGNLYLMGSLIIKKEDPTLKHFLEEEERKSNLSSKMRPYTPFKDDGPPIHKDGSYDVEWIRTFGITVPDHHYFVLGDNHARSADSRIFGFVPEKNIEGAPDLIVWPIGSRTGQPIQKPYPFMNYPRAIVWTLAAIMFALWLFYQRRKLKQYLIK